MLNYALALATEIIMRSFERRAIGAYPFFRLDEWDNRIGAYRPRPGRKEYGTEDEAKRAVASRPGRYRIVRIDDGGLSILDPFDVARG